MLEESWRCRGFTGSEAAVLGGTVDWCTMVERPGAKVELVLRIYRYLSDAGKNRWPEQVMIAALVEK